VRKSFLLLGAVAALAGCNSSNDDSANQAAAETKAAAPKKAKPAYCFFKDSETKDWSAKRGKDGNIVVKGKAYREDGRYKAVLNPAAVTGTTADIAPTIVLNDTGFSAPENWWVVSATIPNSAAVTTVNVRCGSKTVKTFNLPAKG
jgi:hypothetical protein